MQTTKKTVAILFGGKSPEHEVSVITGVQVLTQIDKNLYDPLPIYVAKDGKWYYSDAFFNIETFKDMEIIPYMATEVFLSTDPTSNYLLGTHRSIFKGKLKLKIDVFFPCFHGGLGEAGAFQGLFEVSEKPYVGSEILGSAVGMDKVVCKDILKANDIFSAPYRYYFKAQIISDIQQIINELEKTFKYPMFVKPAVGGSSVGITKAKDTTSLKSGLELAAMFDSKVIVEQGIEDAKEINISVMGNSTGSIMISACEEVFHSSDFLSYDDKYKGDDGKSKGMVSAKRKIPAEISEQALNKIKEMATKAYTCLNCFGLVRIDFLVKEQPLEAAIIEVNTIPGSMAFYLWEASGLKFTDMITKLIEFAEIRDTEKHARTSSFSSNILKEYKGGIKNSKLGQ